MDRSRGSVQYMQDEPLASTSLVRARRKGGLIFSTLFFLFLIALAIAGLLSFFGVWTGLGQYFFFEYYSNAPLNFPIQCLWVNQSIHNPSSISKYPAP
jgi:hypothetical protein